MSDEIQVHAFEAITGTPAAALAVAGWLHSNENGFGAGELDLDPSLHGMVATIKEGLVETPIGVVTWLFDPTIGTIWIRHVYVVDEWRGQGVFTALLNFLIAEGVKLKASSLRVAVHAKNKHAREAYRKTGFTEEMVVCTLEVPQV